MKLPAMKTAAIAFAVPGLAFATPAIAADFEAPTQQIIDVSTVAAHTVPSVFETDVNVEHRRKRRHSHRYDRYDDDDDRRYSRRGRYYDEPVYRDTRIWRDRDGRYRCRKEDGTTGLLIGGAVGGLIGNELAGRGDRTLGAILGAAGGAILGRTIDRSNSRCR
ncbi:MAG: glycine zipper 2TM domain-containing protein [Pontixanthobacter sp.]